jgi:RNA polymerase sigma factor (sigma-70 family)
MADKNPSDDAALEAVVTKAKAGDRAALESLIRAVQLDVRALARRFLWHPQDAEDAAQEILIRVITGLSGFRGESSLRTWVYRIACNTLVTLRAQRMEQHPMSFEAFAEDLAQGLSEEPVSAEADASDILLLEEIKIGCTHAMLLCLDRESRIAYIVGEIMELDHNEASEVLGISPATYRKRLSRARRLITSFMTAHCGLVNPGNACRCSRRVGAAIATGRVDPEHLQFASALEHARRFPRILDEIRRLEETRRAAALYRSHPEPVPSADFAAWLMNAIGRQ